MRPGFLRSHPSARGTQPTRSRIARSRIARILACGIGLAAAAYATWIATAWLRYGQAGRERGTRAEADPLDDIMPDYDIEERHAVDVAAPAAITFAAARALDVDRSPLARAIFAVRTLPSRLRGRASDQIRRTLVDTTQALGWRVLADIPGRTLVMGAYTRPWEPEVTFHGLPPAEFAKFGEPGWVKIVWTLEVEPLGPARARFVTRTRVSTTDPAARARFRRYWALMSPGILLIRRASLPLVRREAERRAATIVLAAVLLLSSAAHGSIDARAAGPAISPDSVRLAVNIPAFRLDLLRGGRVATRYGVAVGQPAYPTPTGAFIIARLELNPSWTPPSSDWASDAVPAPPGPRNPMGRAKLMIQPLYYIHGTPDSLSVGSAGSHGCIRMSNTDILDLAAELLRAEAPGTTDSSMAALLADDGRTRVIVLERPVPVEVYYRPIEVVDDSVLVHRDVYRLWSDSLENDTRRRLEAALRPRRLSPGSVSRLVGRMRALPAGTSLRMPLDSVSSGARGRVARGTRGAGAGEARCS